MIYFENPVTLIMSKLYDSIILENVTWYQIDNEADLIEVCSNGIVHCYAYSSIGGIGAI